MRALFIFTLIGFNFFSAFSQSRVSSVILDEADNLFFGEEFYLASELYDSIADEFPDSHYVHYHKFIAKYLSSERGKDLNPLLNFFKQGGSTDKFYNYWLGRIHFSRYEFDIARRHFEAFLKTNKYLSKFIISEAKLYMEWSDYANEFYLDPSDYNIQPFPSNINTMGNEFFGHYSENHNKLTFASSQNKYKISPSENKLKYNIALKENGKWMSPSTLADIGVRNIENFGIQHDPDSDEIMTIQTVGKRTHLKIASNDSSKNVIIPIPGKGQVSSFFVTPDEKRIIFSYRSSKVYDLYETSYDEKLNEWSQPKILSFILNTDFDEAYPFLSHDCKTLYFSSNRNGSVGGWDVFKSYWDENINDWTTPQNLGYPINTIDDEINFRLSNDESFGTLSSNRLHGFGNYDLYHFFINKMTFVKGILKSKSNRKGLNNYNLDFVPKNSQGEIFRATTNVNGFFDTKIPTNSDFEVRIWKEGYESQMEYVFMAYEPYKKVFDVDFSIFEKAKVVEDFTALNDNRDLKKTEYEKIERIATKFSRGRNAILNNIYFGYNSLNFKKEAIEVLTQLYDLLDTNKEIRIEIGGHTCSLGTEKGNLKVSRQRANAVKKYLVSQGIDSKRIVTKGYGGSQPLASNDDDDEGRDLNRRIEIILLD